MMNCESVVQCVNNYHVKFHDYIPKYIAFTSVLPRLGQGQGQVKVKVPKVSPKCPKVFLRP